MQRITAADDAIVDGNGHYIFQDTSPPAENTIITADWLNAVQEEIAHVIEDAGGTLNPADTHQLAKATVIRIASNITLTVNGSAPYPTIAAAYAFLDGKYINPGVTVTIQLATMTHNMSTPLLINHPQSNQINVLGNTTTPIPVVVDCTGYAAKQAAITIVRCTSRWSGVALSTTTPAGTVPWYGFKSDVGGFLNLSNSSVSGFKGSNIVADNGGRASCTDVLSSLASNSHLSGYEEGFGYLARNGAQFYITTTANIGIGTGNAQGMCYVEQSATMKIENVTISATGQTVLAKRNGNLYCLTVAINNTAASPFGVIQNSRGVFINCTAGASGKTDQFGFICLNGSSAYFEGCVAQYMLFVGFECGSGSKMTGIGASANSNGTYGFRAGTFCYVGINGQGGVSNGTALREPPTPNSTTFSRVD